MSDDSTPRSSLPSLTRNYVSFVGMVIAFTSLACILLLFLIDLTQQTENPYFGIVTYILLPGVLILGLFIVIVGMIRERRRRRLNPSSDLSAYPKIDLNDARQRHVATFLLVFTFLFVSMSAFGSYKAYHYTESVSFCGEACHTVMKPELVTYQLGPHARVACVQCHIGPGAKWFVKAKVSGTYQLYAVAFDKYPRPVPTPIKNLRPAQETCEQCHWPKKFVGNLDRTYDYFLGDETNTPFSVRLTMKVGGGDPTHGPVGGIHWHMNVGNKVQYLASDPARQKIPWVRIVNSQEVVTEFRTAGFTNAVD